MNEYILSEKVSSLSNGKSVTLRSFVGSYEFQERLRRGDLKPLLIELTECYRDIFAAEPWNEYLRCQRSICAGKVGIGDILKKRKLMQYKDMRIIDLETSGILDLRMYRCPLCRGKTKGFYPSKETRKRIESEFQKDIASVLLWDNMGRLAGFIWGWYTTYEKLYSEKLSSLNTRTFSQHEYRIILQQAGKVPEQLVFYLAEWGVIHYLRGSGAAMLILEELCQRTMDRWSHLINQTDVVAYSVSGSKAHRVLDAFKPKYIYDDGKVNICYIGASSVGLLFESALNKHLSSPDNLINGISGSLGGRV